MPVSSKHTRERSLSPSCTRRLSHPATQRRMAITAIDDRHSRKSSFRLDEFAYVYLTRPELRRSCTSPECGRDAQQAHVLAKRGYIQMCHFWTREVYRYRGRPRGLKHMASSPPRDNTAPSGIRNLRQIREQVSSRDSPHSASPREGKPLS